MYYFCCFRPNQDRRRSGCPTRTHRLLNSAVRCLDSKSTSNALVLIISTEFRGSFCTWSFNDLLLQFCNRTEIAFVHLTYSYSGIHYAYIFSRPMGKPTICIGENKGADQLRGNREADQRLCFRYSDSTIPLLLKSENSSFYIALFCACTGRLVSDLFGSHIVGFPTRWLIYLDK